MYKQLASADVAIECGIFFRTHLLLGGLVSESLYLHFMLFGSLLSKMS